MNWHTPKDCRSNIDCFDDDEAMLKFLKWLLLFIYSILILGITCLAIIISMYYLFDINQYKDTVEQMVLKETGQVVHLKGPIKLELFPTPVVTLNQASIQSSFNDQSLLINAKKITFKVRLLSLKDKKIQFNSFNGEDVHITATNPKKEEVQFYIQHIAGRVNASQNHIEILKMLLNFGDQAISGNLSLQLDKKVPKISGKLKINKIKWDHNTISMVLKSFFKEIQGQLDLDIDSLSWDQWELQNTKATLNLTQHQISLSPNSVLIVSNKPITGSLQGEIKVDYDVIPLHLKGTISTSFVKLEKVVLKEVKSQIQLENETLVLNNVGNLAQGGFENELRIQLQQKEFHAQVKFKLNQADASELIKQLYPEATVQSGKINMDLQVQSQGQSVSEWKSQLSGKGLISLHNLILENTSIDSRYVDLFAALAKTLFPILNKKQSQTTVLECGAFRFNIAQGLLTSSEGIGLQTKDLYGLGSVKINLVSEKLDGVIDVYPRSPVNIEIGSYNNLLYLKGTLSNPSVATSAQGIVKEGGSIALGFITGGISLMVEKIYKLATQRVSPCEKILSGSN